MFTSKQPHFISKESHHKLSFLQIKTLLQNPCLLQACNKKLSSSLYLNLEMERKENQAMSEGICRRLFNYIIDSFTARGLKRVTLGHPRVPGSPQEPFLNVTQNEDHALTKPTDGQRYVQTPAHEVPMNGMDSMIFIEIEQANGFKDCSPNFPIEDENENQMQEGFNIRLSTPKTLPVEDQGSNNKANGSNNNVREKDQSMGSTTSISQVHDSNMVSEPVKPHTNGSEKVLGSSAPKKTVSIKDVYSSTDKDMYKKKEKNVMREKLTLVIEPEKDMNVNSPRALRPILRAATNINEKSEDFIRRRREALRKSLSNEPRTS